MMFIHVWLMWIIMSELLLLLVCYWALLVLQLNNGWHIFSLISFVYILLSVVWVCSINMQMINLHKVTVHGLFMHILCSFILKVANLPVCSFNSICCLIFRYKLCHKRKALQQSANSLALISLPSLIIALLIAYESMKP